MSKAFLGEESTFVEVAEEILVDKEREGPKNELIQ